MGLGIGPLELGVVFLVALLVFGPHRLPELMNTVGRSVADFRRALSQVSLDMQNDPTARPARRDRSAPQVDQSIAPPSQPRDGTPPSEPPASS